jgi:ABC-type lipoprotein release transport system permease subunit
VTTLPLLLRLARRNVLRNRRRSAVLLATISFGLWAMLFFAAFIRGWSDDETHSAIQTLTGHLQIHAPGYLDDPSVDRSMPAPDGALRRLLDGPDVRAWDARVRCPAVAMSERETAGISLVGLDPAREVGLSFLPGAVTAGRDLEGVDDRGIVLGRALAARLDTGIGKRVVIMSQGAGGAVVDRGFRVVGLFDADRESTEMTFAFVGRATAADMLGLGDRVSEVAVTLRQPERLEGFVARARGAAAGLDVQPWTTLEPLAHAMVALGRAWIWIFYVVMYVAMAFGLVNTLLMAVAERTREFGLVQALGMGPRRIVAQVLVESSLLLAAGIALGGLLAAGSLALLHGGLDFSSVAAGAEMWGMSKVIHPTLGLGDVVGAVLFIIVLELAASLVPALRASRRVPIEALTRG